MRTINGIIGILGGVVNVEVGKTFQMKPAIIYDYVLDYQTPPSAFVYVSDDEAVATVGENTGVITATGAVDTTCQVTITYMDEEGKTYRDIIDVFVRPEGWLPPDPSINTDNAKPENILKGKKASVNGVQIIGTAECYVENHTIHVPEGLIYVAQTAETNEGRNK